MSKFLIAVGGTGQDVALACLRVYLLASVRDFPHLFIFDPDSLRGGTENGGRNGLTN